MHIPQAESMSVEDAAALDAPRTATIVLYSEGGTHSAQVWFMLRARGYRNVYFLREGMYEWVSRVLNPMLAVDATPDEQAAYANAAEISRYFGGVPRRDVARSALPAGYWTDDHADAATPGQGDAAASNARRRGC